jgi:arylsulfatase A-like enzyme
MNFLRLFQTRETTERFQLTVGLRQYVRCGLLMVLLLLTSHEYAPAIAQSSHEKPPNVLLVVMDAVRADHLSCYGYHRQTSPNLDRFSEESTLYEDCITAAPWTLPSMASIFTGQFPRDHGVHSENLKLSGGKPTLASILGKNGYRTVGFSNNAWLGDVSGLNSGFHEFFEVWRGLGESEPDDGAEITNEWISDWLDSSAEQSLPFFMFILYFEPHFPYAPPPPFNTQFLSRDADNSQVQSIRRWKHPREVGYVLKAPGMEVSPEEFRILTTQYDGEIAYLDTQLGVLFEMLRSRGLLDNTLVIVTSDHGEHLGEHEFMDHKMTVYEEVIRVPLIVRYPDGAASGQRISGQVQNTDVFQTILSLAGVEGSPKKARSLPTVSGKGHEYTFTEFARPSIFLDVMKTSFPGVDRSRFDRPLKVVRSDAHKLIWASDGRNEFYNLKDDPSELKNLYDPEAEEVQEFLRVLQSFERGELPKD